MSPWELSLIISLIISIAIPVSLTIAYLIKMQRQAGSKEKLAPDEQRRIDEQYMKDVALVIGLLKARGVEVHAGDVYYVDGTEKGIIQVGVDGDLSISLDPIFMRTEKPKEKGV